MMAAQSAAGATVLMVDWETVVKNLRRHRSL
jgi:hypothetical protein